MLWTDQDLDVVDLIRYVLGELTTYSRKWLRVTVYGTDNN